ncbi:MAG: cytochrome c oxidase subunit III [Oligoflexia bacterium]|nr:MAG: cytochrome c oxidase subunit III [Oligoflexia bacterium]
MAHTTQTVDISEVPNGRAAMWWVIASEVVIFGGLIMSYLLFRMRYPQWGEYASHTSTPMGALNTLVLLTSSLTVALAHKAATEKNIAATKKYLWFTILGGVIFLIVKSVEYTTEISHGYTITANNFWSFYYAMTGLHAIHVIAGMVAMFLVMQIDVNKGRNLHRVEMAGLYWHFVDIVWIFLFPLLYVAK